MSESRIVCADCFSLYDLEYRGGVDFSRLGEANALTCFVCRCKMPGSGVLVAPWPEGVLLVEKGEPCTT
jgi:hypothetical protein